MHLDILDKPTEEETMYSFWGLMNQGNVSNHQRLKTIKSFLQALNESEKQALLENFFSKKLKYNYFKYLDQCAERSLEMTENDRLMMDEELASRKKDQKLNSWCHIAIQCSVIKIY